VTPCSARGPLWEVRPRAGPLAGRGAGAYSAEVLRVLRRALTRANKTPAQILPLAQHRRQRLFHARHRLRSNANASTCRAGRCSKWKLEDWSARACVANASRALPCVQPAGLSGRSNGPPSARVISAMASSDRRTAPWSTPAASCSEPAPWLARTPQSRLSPLRPRLWPERGGPVTDPAYGQGGSRNAGRSRIRRRAGGSRRRAVLQTATGRAARA
jgi:hypothetical protein